MQVAPPPTELEQLRAQVVTLSRQLGDARRATDVKDMALRRANRFLADRIRDTEQLSESLLKLKAENERLRTGPPIERITRKHIETLRYTATKRFGSVDPALSEELTTIANLVEELLPPVIPTDWGYTLEESKGSLEP